MEKVSSAFYLAATYDGIRTGGKVTLGNWHGSESRLWEHLV